MTESPPDAALRYPPLYLFPASGRRIVTNSSPSRSSEGASHGSRGGTALDDVNHLLRQQNLAAEIRNDVLFISTLKKQSQFLVCHSYRILKGADAGELAKEISSKSAPDSWSAAAKRLITINYDVRDLALAADSSAIAKILTHTVQPASWSEVGGLGKIAAADGELSITQTVQIHRTIETWLADLRTALKPAAAEK